MEPRRVWRVNLKNNVLYNVADIFITNHYYIFLDIFSVASDLSVVAKLRELRTSARVTLLNVNHAQMKLMA